MQKMASQVVRKFAARDKLIERGYFLSIFLIGLPPVFFLFSYINTHSIAKLIWLFSFLILGFKSYQKGIKLDISKTFLLLFLFYFIVHSLSIIPAVSSDAFLGGYEDFFFSSIFFILSAFVVKGIGDIKKILVIFFTVAFMNAGFQAIIYFYPHFFTKLGGAFLHEGYLELILINIERKRVYMEVYDETLIPIIFYFLIKRKNREVLTPLFLLISLFSFVSNFRTRFLMLIMALAGSATVFLKEMKKYLLVLFATGFLFFSLYSILIQSMGFTVVERVFFEDKYEDVLTVTSRIDRWKKSVEIGLSSPLLGVGLGNYYDYLDFSMKRSISLFANQKREFEIASRDPHNIFFKTFAETGFLGLISLIMLLIYFLRKDFSVLKSNDDLSKAFVVSFWILFSHALFNPTTTAKYQTLFWLFRVLIERTSSIRGAKTAKLSAI